MFVFDLGVFSVDNIDGDSLWEGIDVEFNWGSGYGDFIVVYSYLDVE